MADRGESNTAVFDSHLLSPLFAHSPELRENYNIVLLEPRGSYYSGLRDEESAKRYISF